jgi:hypothetical protein
MQGQEEPEERTVSMVVQEALASLRESLGYDVERGGVVCLFVACVCVLLFYVLNDFSYKLY